MRIACIFLSLPILISLFGCQPGGPDGLPSELIGVWKTSAPKYKDCSIELTRDYIIFTNSRSASHVDTNFVLGMKRVPERGHFLCTILYENIHEQKYKFSFYYYPTKDGVIRLKNQAELEWRKVKPIAGQESSPISG
jgi:hypothetical protein